MLIDFCKEYDIPFDLCGKLVVATNESEIGELDKLYYNGLANGLTQNSIIEKDRIKDFEPNVNGLKALHGPYTGIVNYIEVCNKLVDIIKGKGAEIYFNQKVEKIEKYDRLTLISTNQQVFKSLQYINCAGLFSDRIASLSIGNIDTRIIPFRGEYFMLKPERQHLVQNLIYPVPDPNFPFLGVHFTRMIDGRIEAGPNAVFAFKREGYKKSDFNFSDTIESLAWPGFRKVVVKYWKTGIGEFYRSFYKTAFTKALQKLVPDIQEEDLIASETGVRAQACDRMGGLLDDFKIIEESNSIHILNAPSPAATSSLSIANTIADMAISQRNKLL